MSDKFEQAERYAIKILQGMDDLGLYYHNINHSMLVRDYALYLCRKYKVEENATKLMGIAAIYHDLGYVVRYQSNEIYGAEMAGTALERMGFPASDIDFVKRLIMATQMPQSPKDDMERIICDADLSNLGMAEFWECSEQLRRELGIGDVKKWREKGVGLLKGHTYHTDVAKMELGPIKESNLKQLEELVGRQ